LTITCQQLSCINQAGQKTPTPECCARFRGDSLRYQQGGKPRQHPSRRPGVCPFWLVLPVLLRHSRQKGCKHVPHPDTL